VPGSSGCGVEQVLRILVVDDSHSIREWMRKIVELNGDAEVVGEAGNGAVAVDMSRSLHPDVVLMDVEMPVMDGIEATRQIKQGHLAGTVVMVSAFGDSEAKKAAREAGADQFVDKEGAMKEVGRVLSLVAATRRSMMADMTGETRDSEHTL
jgi:DNA-binding NarL/FixJ family response regulator